MDLQQQLPTCVPASFVVSTLSILQSIFTIYVALWVVTSFKLRHGQFSLLLSPSQTEAFVIVINTDRKRSFGVSILRTPDFRNISSSSLQIPSVSYTVAPTPFSRRDLNRLSKVVRNETKAESSLKIRIIWILCAHMTKYTG